MLLLSLIYRQIVTCHLVRYCGALVHVLKILVLTSESLANILARSYSAVAAVVQFVERVVH